MSDPSLLANATIASARSGADGVAAPFQLMEPESLRTGVVFSSPHSGRAYPEEFVASARLSAHQLRNSEDAYVDDLIAQAVNFGAPVLAAVAPRAFVDLNRAPEDMDPNLVEGVDPSPANARVVAGLGVIPRIVGEGMVIYNGKLSHAEAVRRLEAWHFPYHRTLVDLLLRARRRFGSSLLVDCHSMPSGSVSASIGRSDAPDLDIVLGDRFGVSAPPSIVDAIERAFVDAGFRVGRNAPFAGGYITERYGRPSAGVSAVQIEVNRGLYLDQARVTPSSDYAAFRRALRPVLNTICGLIDAPLSSEGFPLAAE